MKWISISAFAIIAYILFGRYTYITRQNAKIEKQETEYDFHSGNPIPKKYKKREWFDYLFVIIEFFLTFSFLGHLLRLVGDILMRMGKELLNWSLFP